MDEVIATDSEVLYAKAILALDYTLSEYISSDNVANALLRVVPLVYRYTKRDPKAQINFSANQIVGLILSSVSLNSPIEKLSKILSDFLSQCLSYSCSLGQSDDFTLIFDNLPPIIAQSLSLNEEELMKAAKCTIEASDEVAIKYQYDYLGKESSSWDRSSYELMFFSFCRARIFRHNEFDLSFVLSEKMLQEVLQFSLSSKQLENWFYGFDYPLEHLSKFTEVPPLVDFDTLYSDIDQIDLIMNTAISKWCFEELTNSTLIPYLNYRFQLWDAFNEWLIKFGDKIICETEKDMVVYHYKIVLELIRQDSLLKAVSKHSEVMNKFVSILISIIYLCPKAILEVLVDSKEILVSLKSLNLDEGEPTSELMHCSEDSIERMYPKVAPTQSFLRNCEKIIETAQRLYANDLSLVEIVNLSSSDKTVQLTELHKFIDSESKYGRNSKQWEALLKSIYWIFDNTNIFRKVERETLDEMILTKLLDLKYFNVIAKVFTGKFCKLPLERSQQLIMKYAWYHYKHATNCDPTIGSLKNSLECLDLIGENTKDCDQLRTLIDANRALLQWKISFTPGVPVTPKQILEINDPQKIIYRILELNSGSYKHANVLFGLMKSLIIGLNSYYLDKTFIYAKGDEDDEELNPLLNKVKLTCLDFASADDSNFAYALSVELLNVAVENKLKFPELFLMISEKWFSFFQFVKNEIEESPSLQSVDRKLSILGQLILVTPTEFNIPVLEHWQLLNTEREQLSGQAERFDGNLGSTFLHQHHDINTFQL
ncbi:hypothetical protein FOA43_003823 [Brettanomyces nanus]|uniref:Sec39 domain-containing protein n=1 Tax=Eeniella nana TaxID=13502 RepID=A0A875SC98_EENNA|nr:uncharacterized protein FOA43_003823 [Brettanomyces nanus]QPG76434.1 hypothetical protein FOA43_003823 [Brettanomyces nanus]